MIRPMEKKDLEWVRINRNDPECRKWFRQAKMLTQEEQEKWFNDTDMVSFVVLDNDGDRVGVVSLSHLDNIARKCEFSIMIIPEKRNEGYGYGAMRELLGVAFNDLNMNQVYSDVFEHNSALEKYCKWGFKKYGKLPQWYWKDGKYIDSVIISITKDEFNSVK